MFGGTDRCDQLIGGLHLYNKGKWSKVESSSEIITPRRQAALVAVSETEILLLGGVDKVDQGTFITLKVSLIFPSNRRKFGIE